MPTAEEFRAASTAMSEHVDATSGLTVPSRPGTDPAGGTASAAGTARDVRTAGTVARGGRTAARSFSPATWAAALADVTLCRLRVGSGDPISTRTTVNSDGETVYEGSMSDQRYMDGNGLPLSPDLRTRDRQIWQAEHPAETPEWAPYPEDEYPVYVDDPSVEGAD